MADRLPVLPDITANFVPLPEALVDVLIAGQLSRQELLVTLYLGRVSYAFGSDRSFVPLDAIAQATLLPPLEAEDALARAIERGTVLHFKTEGPGRFYLLNTAENRRVSGMLSEPAPARAEPPAPACSPVSSATPAAPAATPARAAAPSTPPPPTAPSDMPNLQKRSVSRKLLERIVAVVGRDLTRDETERLTDLGAPEELLLKAVENLVSKNVEVYSSDLVIYEFESLKSSEKRKQDESRKREAAGQLKEKSRSCKRCQGLGYVFIGVSTIKECECRKAPGPQ